MEYKISKYPQFSVCGLNCGLCPRYYTVGSSRCPGCVGEGFSDVHPTCGILSCCQRKGLEYCFECGEFPCKKYNNAGETDSFITQKNQLRDMEKAKNDFTAYKDELNKKIKILQELLSNYDDGRRKSFYCLAVNLLELDDLKLIMTQIKEEIDPLSSLKDKAKSVANLFLVKGNEKNINLKLRK